MNQVLTKSYFRAPEIKSLIKMGRKPPVTDTQIQSFEKQFRENVYPLLSAEVQCQFNKDGFIWYPFAEEPRLSIQGKIKGGAADIYAALLKKMKARSI